MEKYTERKNIGYEVQTYDLEGKRKNVYGCKTLEEVALVLINICNCSAVGNFPTIWKDGIRMK